MRFYPARVSNLYEEHGVSRARVRAVKEWRFERTALVNMRVRALDIKLSADDRAATMRFRKSYTILGGRRPGRGEVRQELIWRRTDDGWKIFSERDV